MKRKKFVIMALILLVAALVAAFGFRRKSPVQEATQVEMVDGTNQPIAFADLRGKVLFVNNWASWCPPCIAEMPSIEALRQKLVGHHVDFVMVSFDNDKNKAENFINKRKYDFDIYYPGQKYPFVTSSIPASFIIDKRGKVIFQHIGMADYSSDEFVNQLKALANE